MWRVRAVVWGIAVVALFGVAAFAWTDEDRGALGEGNQMTLKTRALLTQDKAYLFGTPELIADHQTETPVFSPDGKAILFTRFRALPPLSVTTEPPPPSVRELDILYWDTRTRQTVPVYREPFSEDGGVSARGIYWLSGSRMALIDIQRSKPEERVLLRVDMTAPSPLAHRLTDLDRESGIFCSPTQPIIYTRHIDIETGRSTLRVIFPESGHTREIDISDWIGPLEWIADGGAVFSTYTRTKTPEGKWTRQAKITLIDLNTGQVSHPTQSPAVGLDATLIPFETMAALPVGLVNGNGQLMDEQHKASSVKAVWLETMKKTGVKGSDPLLLATDAEGIALMPDTHAALVHRDGGLYAIPIYPMSIAQYEAALHGAQKQATIANLKQIGIAMMMYTQDYDETLPRNGGDIQELIDPYLRNRDSFNNPMTGKNGFTFTYGGTRSYEQIENTNTTELGILQGPGGHAVLYADGRVKWVDDLTR